MATLPSWSLERAAGWSAQDGSAGAPAGPAQHSRLLAGYAARPPWKVAGVDYSVGFPSTQTFKTPGVDALPSGAAYHGDSGIIQIFGQNVVLDGWDCTVNGGVQIIGAASMVNPTVSNCKFLQGSKRQPAINFQLGSGGGLVTNCVFDQDYQGGNPLAAFVNITGAGGAWTVQYSWFKGVYEDALNLLLNTAGSLKVRWNLFEAGGVGGHPDYLQSFGAGPMSVDVAFNMINHQAVGAGGRFGTQGFSCQDNPTNTRCTGISVRNNCVISKLAGTTGRLAELLYVDPSELDGVAYCQNNYVDLTTPLGIGLVRNTNSHIGPYNGAIVEAGNVNMLTGAAISSG